MNHHAAVGQKTAPLWAHVIAYWSLYLGLCLVFMAIGVTATTRSTDRKVEGVGWVFFVGALLVVLVVALWPRFLFLGRDLRELIARRGGRILRQRRRQIDATIGTLRLLGRLDRPVFDYWPTPTVNLLRWARTGPYLEGGYHPRYMYRMSRIHLLWFGELARIADSDVHVRVAEDRARVEGATGVEVVDQALRAASDVLTQDGLELTVKVRNYGIHVTIVGGTWEGGRFQTRVCQAIGFAERVAAALGARYRGRDPASPKVALTDDVVVVTDREPKVHAQ